MDSKQVGKIYSQPMPELLFQAQQVHREHFDPTAIQPCTLLSVKTGACPEDCNYCSQSAHFKTALQKEKLLAPELVVQMAKRAKERGATRFCMAGAWRSPPKAAMPKLVEMIKEIKAMGLETCVSAGLLDQGQANELKDAGLDYYNHNLDTSEKHYEKIITTRKFQDRLKTLDCVAKAEIKTCCGGILGLGEEPEDRVDFLTTLANLPTPPDSVPINRLVPIDGTPMEEFKQIDPIEIVRTIATARIILPKAMIRLSAGRESMDQAMQMLCFLAGANSIFYGEKLLTVGNNAADQDKDMLEHFGMHFEHETTLKKSCGKQETETVSEEEHAESCA